MSATINTKLSSLEKKIGKLQKDNSPEAQRSREVLVLLWALELLKREEAGENLTEEENAFLDREAAASTLTPEEEEQLKSYDDALREAEANNATTREAKR